MLKILRKGKVLPSSFTKYSLFSILVTNMKNLQSLCDEELQDFFSSFDLVLTDVDGVLWQFLESIPGTDKGIKALQKIGKKIFYVSNNTSKSIEAYHKQLLTGGFDAQEDEIITPLLAIASYLKKQNVTKQIYIIGMPALAQCLESAGFQIAENPPDKIEENLTEFARHAIVSSDNIGAVVADIDINLTYLKLQRAATFLKNPSILFLLGAADKKISVGMNHICMGPGYFHSILENMTNRKATCFSKPSLNLNDCIVEKVQITDTSRVLFIGDSIPGDMAFATDCGYKKLLVLTGLTKPDAITNWTYPEQFKPEFYVDSLKTIYDLVLKVYPNQL